MLNDQAIREWEFGEIEHTYAQRDTMLYALGLGLGSDPLDPDQLRFVYERGLRVMPSMAATLAWPGFWWDDVRTGADAKRLLHGEQSLRLFHPLPVAGTVKGRQHVESLTDKGPGKGAVAVVLRQLHDLDGQLLAESRNVILLRGDGGFSERSGRSDPPPPSLPAPPKRAPDIELELSTQPQAALLYRLSGDYNPLHADPAAASSAGLPRPILHGLCSFGMATHAVLKSCCDYDPRRLRSIAMRFSAPVFPGDTLRFELWRDHTHAVNLRAHVDARATTVLNHGFIEIAD